mmetsp:Transcript_25564/g.57344  ORF Transcript_25564/g.57344 Transcript_25564/m.57344 type:complete len:201 (+) Transcript_25564:356-958(+)
MRYGMLESVESLRMGLPAGPLPKALTRPFQSSASLPTRRPLALARSTTTTSRPLPSHSLARPGGGGGDDSPGQWRPRALERTRSPQASQAWVACASSSALTVARKEERRGLRRAARHTLGAHQKDAMGFGDKAATAISSPGRRTGAEERGGFAGLRKRSSRVSTPPSGKRARQTAIKGHASATSAAASPKPISIPPPPPA